MPVMTGAVGTTSDTTTFEVTRDRVLAYAAATNDPGPAYEAGTAVPPVFGVVPSWDLVWNLGREVIPPDAQLRIVHGEQDMVFHRPMRQGERLESRAEVHSVRVDRIGAQVAIRALSTGEDGEPVVEVLTTSVVRGLTDVEPAGPDRPPFVLPREERGAAVATVVRRVDEDQTFRYAAASGDEMPIHLDAELARQVGLPGIIVHGLCTMALCSQVLLDAAGEADPSRLRRLAVRFTRPVFPGSELVVAVHGAGATPEGRRRYGFEAKSRAKVVVRDGYAELDA